MLHSGALFTSLYGYSLVPVLSVALLLFFTTLRTTSSRAEGGSGCGLSLYCASVAAWCSTLLLCQFAAAAPVGQRLAAAGTFCCASYFHAVWDTTEQRSYVLVYLAYATAAAITLAGALFPGLLYSPVSLAAGPLFWPGMAMAMAAYAVPTGQLLFASRTATAERRRYLRQLLLAGMVGCAGAWSNALLLSRGLALPYGIFAVLAGLLLLVNVVRSHQPPPEQRLIERSLLYAALAALLSAGFLFGVLSLLSTQSEPLLRQYRLGALFLLFMAALAFEPLRQQLQEGLGRLLLRDRVHASDLARELAAVEHRADQAARLAELGAFTSAVAHEVRNPLGVLSTYCRLLQRRGVETDTVDAMLEQIGRAERFVEDLLHYGRPRPLELRVFDVRALLELSLSTAWQGFSSSPLEADVELTVDGELLIEADQGQLGQALLILIDNALRAIASTAKRRLRLCACPDGEHVHISVEDSGPGVPVELLPRLFQPFVTGRKRDAGRPGTGLGLAIARGIVERHHGTIAAGRSAIGGAKFSIALPRMQKVLAAAALAEYDEAASGRRA